MNNLVLIIISVVMGAIGQVVLKIGANKLGDFDLLSGSIIKSLFTLITIPEIIIGVLLFGTSFLLWIKVLTQNELSSAYPMVSLGYIIVTILSFALFKESMTVNKVLGIGLIVFGVIILNR